MPEFDSKDKRAETKREKSYYEMRKSFYEALRERILPKLQVFEEERKQKLHLVIFLSIGLIALGVGLSFFVKEIVFVFMFLIIAFIASVFIQKNFENKIKSRIMPVICSLYGDLWWDCGHYNGNLSMLNASCLIGYYNSSSYDDIFAGTYKGVPFEIIEANYTREQGTGKNRRSVTVFDGIIVKLKMNKNFTGHTVVKRNSVFHSSPSGKLRFTELEDVNFEKKFDVFSDNEIEARYLLTPSFMEKLTGLKSAFSSSISSCAFFKDHFFLALKTSKDLFSIGSLSKPLNDFGQFETLHNELVSIFKIIDYFKMDEKIGL